MANKKVFWLSRHLPDEEKTAKLRRALAPDSVVLVTDPRPIASDRGAEDVVTRMHGYDEVVLTAPTSVLKELCQRGIHPLWPTMSADRRTFLGFDRIVEIRKTTEDVQPVEGARGQKVLWLSRFAPQGRQTAELHRLFGEDVVITHRDIPNTERTNEEFQRGGYDAIVAVVPEAVFERLSALDLPLIRAESVKENNPSRIEFRGGGGQGFRFDRYVWYRIEKLTERL